MIILAMQYYRVTDSHKDVGWKGSLEAVLSGLLISVSLPQTQILLNLLPLRPLPNFSDTDLQKDVGWEGTSGGLQDNTLLPAELTTRLQVVKASSENLQEGRYGILGLEYAVENILLSLNGIRNNLGFGPRGECSFKWVLSIRIAHRKFLRLWCGTYFSSEILCIFSSIMQAMKLLHLFGEEIPAVFM